MSTVVMTVMMELLFLITPQNRSADAQLSMEKLAVAGARQILASALDADLPKISLADWFEKVVGRKAGMVWQLSECGDTTSSDAPACVEVNTLLPDSRKVIVMLVVGTFKKGIAGNPSFYYGVVEEQGKFRQIKRLGDLQNLLSQPAGGLAKSPPLVLPQLNTFSVRFAANNAYLSIVAPWKNLEEAGRLTRIEETPPAPPPARPQSSPPPSPDQPQSIQEVVEQVLTGNAITRVQPVYPPQARMMNAMGAVKVQITVSETGSVIEAKAVSGHKALYLAAVEAAYKWTFKPTTTADGTPIKVQGILTFNFRSK
ncbi:MAG: energy transducer TonB [Chloracidobacterium sp.]|nr:energy transducer TonB [Chloracidobacterium sp.]